VQFLVSISAKSVELIGEEHLLGKIAEFLNQTVQLNPKDIFQLEMELGPGVYFSLDFEIFFYEIFVV
jgi:hypothetical protein